MQEAVLERTVKKPASNPIVADHSIQSVYLILWRERLLSSSLWLGRREANPSIQSASLKPKVKSRIETIKISWNRWRVEAFYLYWFHQSWRARTWEQIYSMVLLRAGRKTESFFKNTKIFFFKSKAKSKAIKKREREKKLLKTAITKLITTN